MRDGCGPGKGARLKSETRDSSSMLSLLNGYRARRARSTSLPGNIGKYAARRIPVFDARNRLFADFQRLLQHVRVILCPSPVGGKSSAGAKDRAKRTQMLAASKTGKHRFSGEMRTFRSVPGSDVKPFFTKRTQMKKDAGLLQQTAKPRVI